MYTVTPALGQFSSAALVYTALVKKTNQDKWLNLVGRKPEECGFIEGSYKTSRLKKKERTVSVTTREANGLQPVIHTQDLCDAQCRFPEYAFLTLRSVFPTFSQFTGVF